MLPQAMVQQMEQPLVVVVAAAVAGVVAVGVGVALGAVVSFLLSVASGTFPILESGVASVPRVRYAAAVVGAVAAAGRLT